MIKMPGGSGIKRPMPKLDCSLTDKEEDDNNDVCLYVGVGVHMCSEFCNSAAVTAKVVHHKSSCVP
jgi:hypothetical protein